MSNAKNSFKYLYSGVVALAVSGTAAIYLNFEGMRCLNEMSTTENLQSQQALESASANCFVITNSYVYALFGVVVGIILLAMWVFKRNRDRNLK
jgi:hypothetical protein